MSNTIKKFREKFVGNPPDYHDEMHQNHKCEYVEKMLNIKDIEQFLQQSEQEIIQDYQTNFEQQHIASAVAVLRNEICEKVESIDISYDSCTGCIAGTVKYKEKVLKIIKNQE